jgi:predicted nuclease of predicted toxin-antitoxin system
VHVRDYHLESAEDERIFTRAGEEGRVIVSADTDFGMLLASQHVKSPSLVLFRGGVSRRPEALVNALISYFPQIEELLAAGAIVVIEPTRVRVRNLPFDRKGPDSSRHDG